MKLSALIIVSVALLCFSTADLQAYELMKSESGDDLHWYENEMPLPWYLNKNGCPDLPFEDMLIALESSFHSWQSIDCSYIEFKYAGPRETNEFGPDAHNNPDFKNTISWVESDWPEEWSEAYAVTIPAYDLSNGHIVDADMEFNADLFTWSILDEESSENPDVQNIATHEIGHFIGLDHSDDMEATLYPYGVPGELHKRTLAEDDILGACHQYPVEGASGWPCADDNDCSGGRLCVTNSDSATRLCTSSCYCDPDCPASMKCVDDYCMPAPHEVGREMGDACSISLPCIEPFVCLEGICSDYCSSAAQCPDNWECLALRGGGRACYGEIENSGENPENVSIGAFSSDRQSPQLARTEIKLSAEINEGTECRFIARHSGGNYTTIKDYSETCEAAWLPTETGSYELYAEVRSFASESCYDARKSIFFTIVSDGEPGDGAENGDADEGNGTGDNGNDDGCSTEGGTGTILAFCLFALLLTYRRRVD